MAGVWETVVGGLLLAAILGGARWGAKYAGRTDMAARASQWVSENSAYVRAGFRWRAVLDCDHPTLVATATICKRVPSPPPQDGIQVRLGDLKSRPFQSRRTFAWQVYATFVPFCAQHGWRPLEIHGWSSPELLAPWQKVWTVDFDKGNIVIAPGWCPIPGVGNE